MPTLFVCNVGTAVALMNTLDVLGSAGTTTTGVGNTITITTVSAGFSWNVVTSASNPITLVPENGYICKGIAPVNFVLPPASVIGDVFFIKGYGNLWTLAQNAGQSVTLGSSATTIGVNGSMAASQIRDSIEVMNVTANTEFDVIDVIGNPIIV